MNQQPGFGEKPYEYIANRKTETANFSFSFILLFPFLAFPPYLFYDVVGMLDVFVCVPTTEVNDVAVGAIYYS